MVRFVASVLIAFSLALGGSYLAWIDLQRVLHVRYILQMINVIETRLRFCATPISELLAIIETSGCGSLRFAETCRKAVENGEAFFTAWKKSVLAERFMVKFMPDETQKLIDMGADIGITDLDSQLACCGFYRRIFENFLADREEKSKRSSKLFPPLGILLGVSAAIFLQ